MKKAPLIKLRKTEKRWWADGYRVVNGTFHCYSFSIWRIGVLVTNSRLAGIVTIFWLTDD